LDTKIKKLLEKFGKNFENINRLLVPNKTDWTICGQVLAMIGSKYGFELVRRTRMTNDCLIAMSARRIGLRVWTHNADDFEIISEFRPFDWEEITE
jgi:predicted nucleic acid-binding protein